MKRQETMSKLAELKPVLVERFGVRRLALFGSTARDEAGPDSEVDIVVGFDGPATSARYFGVQFFLEDALDCPVDLVTEKALRSKLRPYIVKRSRECLSGIDDSKSTFSNLKRASVAHRRPLPGCVNQGQDPDRVPFDLVDEAVALVRDQLEGSADLPRPAEPGVVG